MIIRRSSGGLGNGDHEDSRTRAGKPGLEARSCRAFLTNTSIEKARQDVADPAEPARQRRSIQREPEQHIESALAMWQQASDTV